MEFDAMPKERDPRLVATTARGLCLARHPCEVVQLAAGGDPKDVRGYTCARTADRRLACWGGWSTEPLWVLSEVDDISVGTTSACAVLEGGQVRCWHLGEAATDWLWRAASAVGGPAPTALEFDAPIVDVEVGGTLVCGISAEGQVECRRFALAGARGDDESAPPAPPTFSGAVAQLALSATHGCARLEDDTLVCWGEGADGQLGDGAFRDAPGATPVPAAPGATGLSVAARASCAVSNQQALCWGFIGVDSPPACGDLVTPGLCTAEPMPVPGLPDVTHVALGWEHACALTTGGEVHCWGSNRAGQLGDQSFVGRTAPGPAKGMGPMTLLASGWLHTCASDGHDVYCWGAAGVGQLGRGPVLPFECKSKRGRVGQGCAPKAGPVIPVQ